VYGCRNYFQRQSGLYQQRRLSHQATGTLHQGMCTENALETPLPACKAGYLKAEWEGIRHAFYGFPG